MVEEADVPDLLAVGVAQDPDRAGVLVLVRDQGNLIQFNIPIKMLNLMMIRYHLSGLSLLLMDAIF